MVRRIEEVDSGVGTAVAEFSYDALARRIEKKDCITSANTRRYYYNYNWQMLSEYDGNGGYKMSYIYGNYIDEVLMRFSLFISSTCRYFLHDHLYSPVALAYYNGSPLERYEYDAYGNCHILDAAYNPRASSIYDNPYYFTGRRSDVLDDGALTSMHYRHRAYDTYTGRFLSHDPMGDAPTQLHDRFKAMRQNSGGLCLYEYVQSKPLLHADPYGLFRNYPCCSPIQGAILAADEARAQVAIVTLKAAIQEAIRADVGAYPWFTGCKLRNSLSILERASRKLRDGNAKCHCRDSGGALARAWPFGNTVDVYPPYWPRMHIWRTATLVHEGTHLGAGTFDYYFEKRKEVPHDVLMILGWDMIASTYSYWVINGFCIPGYSGPGGCQAISETNEK